MSLSSVKTFFAEHAPHITVLVLDRSTATVAEAAEGHGVSHAQIAKTLALRVGDGVILIVTRGDARLDNRKYRDRFATKARMLDLSEVEAETGHPVGGVCPFGLVRPMKVYCDVSLKEFDEVVPAAGAPNAAVRISPDEMARLSAAEWVDVSSF